MMKTLLSLFVMSLGLSTANAAMLPGNFNPGSMISCQVYNTTTQKQRILQVQYNYYCESTPQHPGGYQWQTTGCMGFCEVDVGHTSYQSGPFTWCRALFGNCQAWTQEIPADDQNK